MSRSTSWVFPDGVRPAPRPPVGGHLALQLREECPPPRLLVQRQETGPVDPGDYTLCGALRRSSRDDIGQTGQGIGR